VKTSLFFALLGLIAILFVFAKVKKQLLSEKESFFWIFGAVIVFVLSIFPKTIDYFSELLGITYPPSLLFLLAFLFMIFLLFRQSQQISLMNERLKELAQKTAISDQKIRESIARKDIDQ